MSTGTLRLKRSPLLRDLREPYRLYLVGKGLAGQTVTTYMSNLERFARWCEAEHLSVTEMTHHQLVGHVADIVQRHSRSYGNTRIAVLKSLYGWLANTGQREDNPADALRMRGANVVPRTPYTGDELSRLLAHAETAEERAILLMLVGSGVRKGELLGMRADDIDWRRGVVLIRHQKGGGERWVAPGFAAMKALRAHIRGSDGPVWVSTWGRSLSKTGLALMLHRLAKRASVANVIPHRFRATTICSLLDAGADLISVSVIAGHSDLETTRRYQQAVEGRRALDQQRRFNPADRIAIFGNGRRNGRKRGGKP